MELAELIETYRGPLIGLIASWGARWGEAGELAQDSFSEAWLRRDACRGDWRDPEVFAAWLRGVARNRFRNWARGRRRWFRLLAPEQSIESVAAPVSLPEPADEFDELRQAIKRLPGKQRQVVLMHYLEETSVERVAALLAVSPKAVEGRLYQARRNLRRLLEPSRNASIPKVLLCLWI
jgi:RNA polymerase sigma factor (sigma-70 family)